MISALKRLHPAHWFLQICTALWGVLLTVLSQHSPEPTISILFIWFVLIGFWIIWILPELRMIMNDE